MSAFGPASQGGIGIVNLALTLAHGAVLLLGELIGEQVQQVLWPRLALYLHLGAQLAFQLLTEIQHLAPEVVLLRPADEVGNLLRPFVAVGHIQHHPFQPGNHIGAVAQHTVGVRVVEVGRVFVFLSHLQRQLLRLRTLDEAVGGVHAVDVGLQLGGKAVVVDAQDGRDVVVVAVADDG